MGQGTFWGAGGDENLKINSMWPNFAMWSAKISFANCSLVACNVNKFTDLNHKFVSTQYSTTLLKLYMFEIHSNQQLWEFQYLDSIHHFLCNWRRACVKANKYIYSMLTFIQLTLFFHPNLNLFYWKIDIFFI
jgi:hypothetical protein